MIYLDTHVVAWLYAGEVFSEENVRSIRPGYGMHTRYLTEIIGKQCACDIARGSPLSTELVRK